MNIILIGMPGCGKSTVGVLLAKTMLMGFCDTDLLIQRRYGHSLCELIDRYGLDGFKEMENRVLAEFREDGCVVATGGSAVYGKEGMSRLKTSGVTVYLQLSPADIEGRIHNITTRGIAMPAGTTIADLYTERSPLYEHYADVTVDCTGLTAEECVTRIKEALPPS